MVYGCGCGVVSRPNRLMTIAKMMFFWLPLLTMNCGGEKFTHICEWKRSSPSFGSLGLDFWTLVVETVALDSMLIIYFPLSLPLLSFGSESKHALEC